jgi:hypothetical protein
MADGRRGGYHARWEAIPAVAGRRIARSVVTECEQCGQPLNSPAEEKYRAASADLRNQIHADVKLRSLGPGEPMAISRVFRSRHLSATGPTAAAYVTFGLIDLRFVDLEMHTLSHGLKRVRSWWRSNHRRNGAPCRRRRPCPR